MSKRSVEARLLGIFFAVFIAALVLLAGVAILYGADSDALRASLRLSGRLSFLLFLWPFAASPLAKVWPSAKPLRRYRREAGVAYAGAQTAHVVLIATLIAIGTGRPIPLFVYVFGGAALALMYAMSITSFPGPAKRVGRVWWQRIHTAGIHASAAIFAFDFVKGSIVGASLVWYLPFAVLVLAVYGLRTRNALVARRTVAAAA